MCRIFSEFWRDFGALEEKDMGNFEKLFEND